MIHSKKAFTLFELVLVLLLISIIFSTAAVRFNSSYHHTLFKTNCEEVINFIQYTKEKSILLQKDLYLFIDERNAILTVFDQSEENEKYNKKFNPIGPIRLHRGFDISCTKDYIHFLPNGFIHPFELKVNYLELNARIQIFDENEAIQIQYTSG